MPWCRTGATPSLELVLAAHRIIQECDPAWWVLENVKGSIKWLEPILGPFRASYGAFFLWGRFPDFRCRIRRRKKESFGSKKKAERAMIPPELSLALAKACETDLYVGHA
jgi:site-specific DNA-cytosine methylase